MNQLVANSAVFKVDRNNLTPAQKKFNRLTKSLQREKQLLSLWQEIYNKVKIRYGTEVDPLAQEVDQSCLELLLYLDKIYQDRLLLTNPQKKKLLNIIKILLDRCVNFTDQVKAIHDRYSDISYDDLKEEAFDEMRFGIKEILGIDLGEDFDFESEDAIEKFMGKLSEKAEEEDGMLSQRKVNKKSKSKQKESSSAVNLESHSLRDVFRKLAKVLHPDREQDEQERIRKSELMQRANVAYEKKDLLALLELQIEIQQADQADINNLTEERLQAYNKLLQNQSDKLKQEIQFFKQRLNFDFNIPLFCKKEIEVFYYVDLKKEELSSLKRELINDFKKFQDIQKLKQWINALKKDFYLYD